MIYDISRHYLLLSKINPAGWGLQIDGHNFDLCKVEEAGLDASRIGQHHHILLLLNAASEG